MINPSVDLTALDTEILLRGTRADLPARTFRGPDLVPDFRSIGKLRDWLPIRREHCAKRVLRKSRWSRSSARRIAQRHGISEQTIYTWRKRFGEFQANDVRRLKELEAENVRLKKLVAERDLEIEVMKEVAAKNW
jgi:putative transposase